MHSFVIAFQMACTSGGWGIRPLVDSFLNILSPQSIVACRGGGRTVAGQVLASGETGVGEHVVEDGTAIIVTGGRR